MKKIYLLIVSFLFLLNCSNDVTFNSPAFQGQLDGVFWKATSYSASIDDVGFLTITGSTTAQTISLTIPSVAVGTYTLGDVTSMEAKVVTSDGTTYLATSDGTLGGQLGEGQIILENIGTNNGLPSFTGTFWFNAYSTPENSISFNEGVFFKIPLLSGSIPDNIFTCTDGQTESAAALANYTAASTSAFIISADFESTCATYKLALEKERVYCGDVDGSIQTKIDALGDCIFTCDMAMANTTYATTQFNNTTIGNALVNCIQYQTALTEQQTLCGDDDNSLQDLLDTLYGCLDNDGDSIPRGFENPDPNDDGNLADAQNTDGDTFVDYDDNDDDNDGILTIDEIMADEDGNPADTDGDNIPNYLDDDDDGDGILTIFESGDSDGDTILDYLDDDDDDDGILTINENPDANADGNPNDAIDTDSNATPDYLDNDDDGDGILTLFESGDTDNDTILNYLDEDDDGDGNLTSAENADPNADGNPDDAVDTDGDMIPDYLDMDS